MLDNKNEYMTFQSLTDHFPLCHSPDSFNDCVKLYAAIPESWVNYAHSQRNLDHHFDPFHNAKQNAMNVCCSSKSVYLYLMEKQSGLRYEKKSASVMN